MKARILIMTAMAASIIGAMSISAEDAVPIVTENTQITAYILGDVNSDSVVNVRDCAFIARKLAENKADELSHETADYNKDTLVNVRDAASIATTLGLNLTPSTTITEPKKADYDLKSINGMKNYINETLIYNAKMEHGITDIKADDSVESNTWYSPTILITNLDFYSSVTSVMEYGMEGIMPESYAVNVDDAVQDLMKAFDFISQRSDLDGTLVDMSQRHIRIKWLPIDNGGNFEIYVCYGGDY